MQTTEQVVGEISSSLTNWGFSLSESSSGMLIMACCCATLSPLDAEPAWHMPVFLHLLCSNSWHNAFYSRSLFTSHVFLSPSTCGSNFLFYFFIFVFLFFYNNFLRHLDFQLPFQLRKNDLVWETASPHTFIYMCRHAGSTPCTAVSAHSVSTSHMVPAIILNIHIDKPLMTASDCLPLVFL